MKKFVVVFLALMTLLSLVPMAVSAGNGNGIPNGPHYNLNIIGAPKDKSGGTWDNTDRHTIMVDRNGNTNIYMTQGDGFAVLDGDGTDGRAEFQLGPGRYEVYAVALGKPNKSVTITPEATFVNQTAEEVFYLGSITLDHNKKPKWERVTGMFLVTVSVNMSGNITTYHNEWVFDIPELIEYWWQYNNSGCRLTQVRFYQVASIPEEGTI